MASGVDVIGLMADIADKLQLLNYQADFCRGRPFRPLSRYFFAVATRPSDQFPYFSALMLWLLRDKVAASFDEWSEFEDPSTVSAAIVTQLRRLGLAADFPVSKLRHGSGDAVCLCLDFALTKALEAARIHLSPPQYAAATAGGEAGGGEEEDVEDEAEEELDDGVAEEDMDDGDDGGAFDDETDMLAAAGPAAGAGGGAADGGGGGDAVQGVIESNVDPGVWAAEVARVAPRLKFRSAGNTKEWRTHIEQAERHGGILGDELPKARAALEGIGAELRKAVERLSAKERHINNEFESLGRDFREKQAQLDSVQQRYNELSEQVAELTQELAAKSEQVETLKAKMEDRSSSMTDTSPVRRITVAIADLKKEVAAMELRIGVAMQSLLHHIVRDSFGTGSAGGQHESSLAHMESVGRGGVRA